MRLSLLTNLSLLLWIEWTRAQTTNQQPLVLPHENSSPCSQEEYTCFSHEIRRVAVIGAGPSGLQAAAALLDHGKEVRLFERTRAPGGNWNWSPLKPIHESFPNKPLDVGAYEPDIPSELPSSRIYEDGEDGISNDWRLREHWSPSPVWDHLRVNSNPGITSMPGIKYPEDSPWDLPNRLVLKNVRQYASSVGISSNDDEYRNITSYSTRVEKMVKPPGATEWTLTLRKLEILPYSGGKVRAEWWTEKFDAVVVASGPYDTPWLPHIPGLDEWARAYPDKIYHSRQYRSPYDYVGKNVLVVGGSVSASEISRDLALHVANFSVSIRPNLQNLFRRRSFLRLPHNITHLPVIKSFPPLPEQLMDGRHDIRNLTLQFENGTVASGFDEIIFATGFRRSMPFLVGFHNSSIAEDGERDAEVPPIITDGTRLHSIHWTGHYIPDPTLAFTMLRPWTLGRYQSLGIAKVWSDKARLPSTTKMWETYPGAQGDLHEQGPFGTLGEEAAGRLWVGWLNAANLEFGGRLVDPVPFSAREEFIYFSNLLWEERYINHQTWIDLENTPRSEWPRRSNDPVLSDV